MDHSEKDYQGLLNLPELIGPLSNADNLGVKFRAPLWEMSKAEIHIKLLDDVKPLLIPNGHSYTNWSKDTATHTPHKCKLQEWKDAGILGKDEYTYELTEASWIVRYMTGTLLPGDVDQPDTPSMRDLLRTVAPFLAKARTIIRPKDVTSLRSEVAKMVRNLITDVNGFTKEVSERN